MNVQTIITSTGDGFPFGGIIDEFLSQNRIPGNRETYVRLRKALGEAEPSLKRIEEIVLADASFSALILKIANSGSYTRLRKTSFIRAAILRLGLIDIFRIANILEKKNNLRPGGGVN